MSKFERKEYKYFVPQELQSELRKRLLQQMVHDPFCRDREQNQYCVRSIYLDTDSLLFYHEKIDGIRIRKKLRVRVYNDIEARSPAFLEIKRKFENTVFKERIKIPLPHTATVLNGANLQILNEKASFSDAATLGKFIYLIKRLKLLTRVLVTYEREAFQGIDDPSLRITFDLNARSFPNPRLEDIYREQDLTTFTGNQFILEIKFNGRMPNWVRNIVRDYRLHLQAISKYCNGIDTWMPEYKRQGHPNEFL